MKPGEGILGYLKHQGRRPRDLPLNVLRQFQEFEKAIAAQLRSYEGRGPEATYAMKSFAKIEMLAMTHMLTDKCPAVHRCHEDMMKRFQSDSAFADDVGVKTWVLFNFPMVPGGRTLAEQVLDESSSLADELSPFVRNAVASRLGLYEVLQNDTKRTWLRELFTENEVIVSDSLGAITKGMITVCRVLNIKGSNWVFGNAPGFPATRRAMIVGMVREKMGIYFDAEDDVSSYETMMRLAGPYWFSVIANDRDEILNPDHYLSYYRDEGGVSGR